MTLRFVSNCRYRARRQGARRGNDALGGRGHALYGLVTEVTAINIHCGLYELLAGGCEKPVGGIAAMPVRSTVRGAQAEVGLGSEPQFCCPLQFWSWIL